MINIKCHACDAEYAVDTDNEIAIIGLEMTCYKCEAKGKIGESFSIGSTEGDIQKSEQKEEGLCTLEDIKAVYDIVSHFNNQILCEERGTERLISFAMHAGNQYRMLG